MAIAGGDDLGPGTGNAHRARGGRGRSQDSRQEEGGGQDLPGAKKPTAGKTATPDKNKAKKAKAAKPPKRLIGSPSSGNAPRRALYLAVVAESVSKTAVSFELAAGIARDAFGDDAALVGFTECTEGWFNATYAMTLDDGRPLRPEGGAATGCARAHL